jgi:hypothetical protein
MLEVNLSRYDSIKDSFNKKRREKYHENKTKVRAKNSTKYFFIFVDFMFSTMERNFHSKSNKKQKNPVITN